MGAEPQRIAVAGDGFAGLHAALAEGGVEALLAAGAAMAAADPGSGPAWARVAAAVRLGAVALAADPDQLAGQLVGRLRALGAADPVVAALVAEAAAWQGAPWLRPATPSVAAPGGALLAVLSRCGSKISALALTPDGRRAVAGTRDGAIELWDVDGLRPPTVLEGHDGPVESVVVGPDGTWAVSGSADCTLRIWDLERGRAIGVLEGHEDWVRLVTLTPDGRRALSGADDNTVRVWDLELRLPVAVLEGHEEWVRAVAVSPDGRIAVSGDDDGSLRTWDLASFEPLGSVTTGSHISGLAVTPDGRVVAGTLTSGVQLRDLADLRLLEMDDDVVHGVTALAVSPDGRVAVCGLENGSLYAWYPATEALPGARIGRCGAVRALAIAGDGSFAVVGSDGGGLTVWDLGADADLAEGERHAAPVTALAVTPDGRVAVSGGGNQVKVWDEASLPGPRATVKALAVKAVAVSDDGRRFMTLGRVTGMYELTKFLDADRLTVVGERDQDTAWSPQAMATPDGRVGLSIAGDGTVTVWDRASLEPRATLDVGRSVTAAAVSPNGRLAGCVTDGGLQLWDLERSELIATFTADLCLTVLAVADSGPFTIIAGDASGMVHLLELVEPGA